MLKLALTSIPSYGAASVLALMLAGPGAALGQDSGGVAASATAELQTIEGKPAGTVRIAQLAHGALFVAELKNLPAGGHAFHVHETGKCKPDFKAAGGHYNPTGSEHGLNSSEGYHAGDLPNVYVSEAGSAKAAFFSPTLSVAGDADSAPAGGPFPLMDADGSAIMIHGHPDNYLADPPNSSGPRIACGVIQQERPQ